MRPIERLAKKVVALHAFQYPVDDMVLGSDVSDQYILTRYAYPTSQYRMPLLERYLHA